MPVRSTIHSSVVSTRLGQFGVATRGARGRAEPVPAITERSVIARVFAPGAEIAEILGDPAGEIVAHQLGGDCDRVGDADFVGAAMALHDDAVEAEEDRAIMIVGVEMVRAADSVAGREIRKPIFERIELVKARRSRSATKRAVPSAVLSAILPEKPSHTITSTSPRDSWSPSMKP